MSSKYEYSITQLAYEDIDNALNYISNILHNPEAASTMYTKIEKEIGYITKFPFSRPGCSYYYIDDENIRHSIIGKYVMIYQVEKEKGLLTILRFLPSQIDFSTIDLY